MATIKPSLLLGVNNIGSVCGTCESETVMDVIIQILSRTGDTWRVLSVDEYKRESSPGNEPKDDAFMKKEIEWFNHVVEYSYSLEAAAMFCFGYRQAICDAMLKSDEMSGYAIAVKREKELTLEDMRGKVAELNSKIKSREALLLSQGKESLVMYAESISLLEEYLRWARLMVLVYTDMIEIIKSKS